mmetsp:Transcript_32272/g.47047  ORF Transcript_32272/g.47047 Transcript_32272/m.47047 type:complete len:132 (-) Transcript_32272:256-651(-)
MRHQPSIQTLAVTAITGTVTILTTIYITKSISQYGLSGTLRLLWEGDHLTPECRESMDTLDQVQNKTIPKLGKKIGTIGSNNGSCQTQLCRWTIFGRKNDDDGRRRSDQNTNIDAISKNENRFEWIIVQFR